MHLGLVGHQRREQAGQAQRLGTQLDANRRAVAGVEHEIDDGEDGPQPVRQQMLRRDA